tara:strand:+ start:1686 stop:2126 length:441 start_codon:yes stop_codon:yes gene_type:complete
MKKVSLYFDIAERTSGGEPLSDEQWSDRAPQHTEIQVKSASFTRNEGFWVNESFLVDPDLQKADKLYLVIVRYQDGDTFGTSYGNHQIVACYDTYDAAWACDPNKVAEYRSWDGYFSRWEGKEIYEFDMKHGGMCHAIQTIGGTWS